MFSATTHLKHVSTSSLIYLRHLPFLLWIAAFILIVLSAARIQKGIEYSKTNTEGIDIVLTVDTSTSMYAEDFIVNGKRHNRLVAVKAVVNDFIDMRKSDRIGLVLFAGQAYTQCPLTLDYEILRNLLDKAQIGMIEDGTALGTAIGSAVNRLKTTKAKSKIIILLTDGENNKGRISPEMAAKAAKALNIKVYTIGVGTRGKAPVLIQDQYGNTRYVEMDVNIDEELLTKIAGTTGGKYFRATDTASLKEIYKIINNLEKTKTEVNVYNEYKELFTFFLLPAIFILLLEIILTNTVFRKLP